MSMQFVSIVAALMVFGAFAMVFVGVQQSRARASSPEMEDRLDRYASINDVVVENDSRTASFVSDRIDQAVKGKSFAEKTATALARADLRMTVGEFLLVRGGSAGAGFLVGMFIGRGSVGITIVFGLVFAIVGWMVPPVYLSMRAKRRQKAFVNQLGDTISLMANSLRAGYSLLQTMELVSREAPSPISDEFRRVVREVGLGVTPHQALNNMLRRVPSEDLDFLVTAINIQHEIGGNLSQILDVIGETIRERVRIKGEIDVLTAQGKISSYVITGIPFALALFMFVVNRDYIMDVFVWPWICIPIGAFIMIILGYLALRKITAIEV